LPELVLYAMDNESRRLFSQLVKRAFYPDNFDPETPPEIVADWYADHDSVGIEEVLRQIV
jgi:hypothetical protein